VTRILVTGSEGFIGSRLVPHLRRISPGAEIVGIDNLWTGVRRTHGCLSEFRHENVCTLQSDWVEGFDEVWMLASPASPRHYQAFPMATITTNVNGMMVSQAYVRPGGMLFLASTSEVYGDPLVSPQPETYLGSVDSLGPRACYDNSKRLCETMMYDLWREGKDFRPRVARLFNVYGPGTLENDGRAVSNFVCQALRQQDITVMGTGLQTRAFTYIDDVVHALVCLVRYVDYAGPVNIGTSRETTVLEIAQYIAELSGGPSRVVHVPAAVDDPRQRLPDLRLCERVLGWRATTTYEVGLRQTMDYFRETLGL
jgi:nucleoside-diphosphate-sugar epimerase